MRSYILLHLLHLLLLLPAISAFSAASPAPSIRIGHGFDIHRMSPITKAGQPLIIGGVEITHSPLKWLDVEGEFGEKGATVESILGCEAHSDGDVVYHSVVDAIFGALALPDIGQVFQDSDPRWRGCDSSKFMEHARGIMDEEGTGAQHNLH